MLVKLFFQIHFVYAEKKSYLDFLATAISYITTAKNISMYSKVSIKTSLSIAYIDLQTKQFRRTVNQLLFTVAVQNNRAWWALPSEIGSSGIWDRKGPDQHPRRLIRAFAAR